MPVYWQSAEQAKLSETVYLSLGSNQGDRMANLRFGLEQLKRISEGGIVEVSSVYETEPWGVGDQPDYLNIAVRISWTKDAFSLLEQTQNFEVMAGRERKHKKGQPRTLDIDILLFGEHIMSSENLTVPHASLTERRFVLQPLSDIAAEAVIATTGLRVREALLNCVDDCRVKLFSAKLGC